MRIIKDIPTINGAVITGNTNSDTTSDTNGNTNSDTISDTNSDTIRTIVGEMLNIETSTLHYINGIPIGNHAEYNGYPRIIHPHCYDAIRAVEGYIFIPSDLPIDEFETKLIDTIQIMERSMTKPNGEKVLVLKNYQSVRVAYGTNIKLQSSNERTVSQLNNHIGKKSKNNMKREFMQLAFTVTTARFTWRIMTINTAIEPIKTSNILDSISRYVSSIFYDKHDICILGHNDVTFDFSRAHLKNYTNAVEYSMNLMEYGNPIAAELSPLWSHMTHITLRTIEKPIYRLNYNVLELQYVNAHIHSETNPYSICAKCMGVLWGDNYVLVGRIHIAANAIGVGRADCIALCPLCLQVSGNSNISYNERSYYKLFRVTYPLTCEDVIDALILQPLCRIIYYACLQFTEKNTIVLRNGSTCTVFLIGDKYVSFENANDYLFGDADDVELIKGRIAVVKSLSKK